MSTDYLAELHKEIVTEHPEGISVADVTEAVFTRFSHEQEIGIADEVPIEELRKAYVTQGMGKVRGGARRSGRRNLPILARHLARGEDLPEDLAILDDAFPVGDGTDKVLRYWTLDDWEAMTGAVTLNRDYVNQQANESLRDSEVIIGAFKTRKAKFTGDLFAKAKVPSPKKRVVS